MKRKNANAGTVKALASLFTGGVKRAEPITGNAKGAVAPGRQKVKKIWFSNADFELLKSGARKWVENTDSFKKFDTVCLCTNVSTGIEPVEMTVEAVITDIDGKICSINVFNIEKLQQVSEWQMPVVRDDTLEKLYNEIMAKHDAESSVIMKDIFRVQASTVKQCMEVFRK
jgi:hypothetical protein